MQVDVARDRLDPLAWRVEAWNMGAEGEGYLAMFEWNDARERAIEYARFKYPEAEISIEDE